MAESNFNPTQTLEEALGDGFTDLLGSAVDNLIESYGGEFAQMHGLDSPQKVLETIDDLYNWIPSENFTAKQVYYKLCSFYLFFGTAPLAGLQNPIRPYSYPPATPLSQWIIDFAKNMGSHLSQPGSLTPESLQTFIESPSYHMASYFPGGVIPPLPLIDTLGWENFNDFFSRSIPDIDTIRPVAFPNDDTIVVSPADFTFAGQWPIDSDGAVNLEEPTLGSAPPYTLRILQPIPGPGVAVVKGIPWTIAELLGTAGEEYASQFANGTFIHGFLGPTDYHRQHAPVSGEVLFAGFFSGLCHLQVDVVRDERGSTRMVMNRYMHEMNAPNSPGYQFLQARGLILIDNPTLGLVAMLPIGMCQISSVAFTRWGPEGIPLGGTNPPTYVKKGEEVSKFLFGGSDCIVCFGPKAKMTFNAYSGEWLRVNSQMGYSTCHA